MKSQATGSQQQAEAPEPGERMYRLAAELFPWHRSITGQGLRRTLQRIGDEIPLALTEVPSGEDVFDFTVPPEWNIRDAWIADQAGRRVVDYRASNLHVVSYSRPVVERLTWAELRPRLYSLPERPDWIPYRTAYFRDEWGFCLRHRDLQRLAARGDQQVYDVRIEAELKDGSLTYGEWYQAGETAEEVLLSTHVCHPSLANDNLSGIAVGVELARWLAQMPRRRYSYRMLLAPATIGALAWLSRNRQRVDRVRHGLVLAQLGDSGPLTYKRSRRHDAPIDRAAARVVAQRAGGSVRDFEPYGYDERQFCSPGFNLPIGRLTRTPEAQCPEYHTSADDLSFISAAALADSLSCCQELIRLLEANRRWRRTNPYGEPRLSRYGLYSPFDHQDARPRLEQAVLWVLNLADGTNDLLDMAERSGAAAADLLAATELLARHGLIQSC